MQWDKFENAKRYYRNGKLVRIKHGGYDMKITSETIKVQGCREWCAVTYMDSNENREHCAVWVIGLINKGIIKPEA
jgi:hypothetical protein